MSPHPLPLLDSYFVKCFCLAKLVMVLFILSRHLVWTINHSMLWMNRVFWIFRRAPLHLQGAPLYSPDHLRHSFFLGQSPSFLSLCLQVSLANQSLFLHSACLDCLFLSCSRVAVETYKACVHHMVSTLVSLPVFTITLRTNKPPATESCATFPLAGGILCHESTLWRRRPFSPVAHE